MTHQILKTQLDGLSTIDDSIQLPLSVGELRALVAEHDLAKLEIERQKVDIERSKGEYASLEGRHIQLRQRYEQTAQHLALHNRSY